LAILRHAEAAVHDLLLVGLRSIEEGVLDRGQHGQSGLLPAEDEQHIDEVIRHEPGHIRLQEAHGLRKKKNKVLSVQFFIISIYEEDTTLKDRRTEKLTMWEDNAPEWRTVQS
jgi:hypothetical protein